MPGVLLETPAQFLLGEVGEVRGSRSRAIVLDNFAVPGRPTGKGLLRLQ